MTRPMLRPAPSITFALLLSVLPAQAQVLATATPKPLPRPAHIAPLALTEATPTARPAASPLALAIEAATFTGADLRPGQSPLTAKVQLLLDRSGISPGVVDGFRGGMSTSALKAFQRREGLPINGLLTQEVWDRLQPYAADPIMVDYTITEQDVADVLPD